MHMFGASEAPPPDPLLAVRSSRDSVANGSLVFCSAKKRGFPFTPRGGALAHYVNEVVYILSL